VYESSRRLALDPQELRLGKGDFAAALSKVVPASRRSSSTLGRPLDPLHEPLLRRALQAVMTVVREVFPPYGALALGQQEIGGDYSVCVSSHDKEAWIATLTDVQDPAVLSALLSDEDSLGTVEVNAPPPYPSPAAVTNSELLWSSGLGQGWSRVLLSGGRGMGQAELAAAVLHQMESFPAFSLEYGALLADTLYANPEQSLLSRIQEAGKCAPSVVYLPDVLGWWKAASESMRAALVSAVESGGGCGPLLWLCTVSEDVGSGAET